MIGFNDIVACICEGNSEKNIMKILLNDNLLIFSKEQLLDDRILTNIYRSPKIFTNSFLTMDYKERKIVVLLIQDSKNKTLKIKEPYSDKLKTVYLVVTAPEIEMLMIHSLKIYNEFQKVKSSKKPSEFVAEYLKCRESKIKNQQFINDFYKKHDLKRAMIQHKQKAIKSKDHIFLCDLLK